MHERRPSLLDRLLRPFTDVRAGEGTSLLLLTLNAHLILASYYVLKVLRDSLILTGAGAELKSYASAFQAMLLLGLVPAYGALASRLPRRGLINAATAFFLACIVAFYVLLRLGLSIAFPFFIWVGIFNLMVVTQFWSFANDVYTTDEGKRLFPVVGFGASSGAVVGSWLTGLLIGTLGLPQLFLVAAAILGAAVMLTNVIDARERRRTEAHVPDALTSGTMPAATGQYRALSGEFRAAGEEYQKESGHFRVVRPGVEPESEHHGTFALVFRSRYLLLIGLLVLLLNWVNATGEYILGRTLERIASDTVAAGGGATVGEIVGRFYAAYQGGASLLAMLLQLFVVSRVLKYLGVRTALLILPALAFGGYALLAFAPILAVMRWVKTAENATDYSIQKTAANVLFLPTTREEKYKGKQVIDALFYRTGDLLSAALVYVGTAFLAFQPQQFALVNLGLVAAWIALAVMIGRRYERLAAATAR